MFVDVENINNWSVVLKKCQISSGDFESIQSPNRSWIYCDPPYIDSFTSYGVSFGLKEQRRVFDWCRKMAGEDNLVIFQNKSNGTFFEEMVKTEKVIYENSTHTAGRRKKTIDGKYLAREVKEMIVVF